MKKINEEDLKIIRFTESEKEEISNLIKTELRENIYLSEDLTDEEKLSALAGLEESEINNDHIVKYLSEGIGTYVGIAAVNLGTGIISWAALITGIIAYARTKLQRCARMKLEGEDRLRCRVKAAAEMEDIARSRISMCSKSNNPPKCKVNMAKEATKWKHRKEKWNDKLREYR